MNSGLPCLCGKGMPTGCKINLAKSTVRVVDIVVKMFFILMCYGESGFKFKHLEV